VQSTCSVYVIVELCNLQRMARPNVSGVRTLGIRGVGDPEGGGGAELPCEIPVYLEIMYVYYYTS
jgi:hypothetical protein